MFCMVQMNGQTLKAYEKAGDEAMATQNYFGAYTYYKEGISIDTSVTRLKYKFGKAARQWLSYDEANEIFQKIDNKITSKLFSDFEYEWALTKITLGTYDEAIVLLKRYLKKSGIPQQSRKKAKKQLQACLNANQILKKPLDIDIKHLDKNINSPYSEFAAVEKDSILYFSALKFKSKSKEAYFSKILTTQNQEKARLAKKSINKPDLHNANVSFSQDGQFMYFTRCINLKEGGIRCEIYRRDLTEKRPKDELLPSTINLEGTTNTHPSIAFDENKKENVLFFVSDRVGGKGGLDIWMSTERKGKFTKPKNLGRNINTSGNEISPFFYNGSQELYFSSDEHIGLGGFDIYKTKKVNNTWQPPSNVGFPVNSSYNDTYYSLNENGANGYFSSNRKGSFSLSLRMCCYDIYTFQLKIEKEETIPNDTVLVQNELDTLKDFDAIINEELIEIKEKREEVTESFDDRLANMLPIALYFDNDKPDSKTLKTTTKKTYDKTYFEYYARKNTFVDEYTTGLESSLKSTVMYEVTDFFDYKVKAGYDKLALVTGLIATELQTGKQITIHIKGFTSPRASGDYNKNLSQRRISSVKNYFNQYEAGILLKYIKLGQLRVVELSFGETQSNTSISDDLKDRRNSIFSPSASLERRVEILQITTTNY